MTTSVTVGGTDVPANRAEQTIEFLQWWFPQNSNVCLSTIEPRHVEHTILPREAWVRALLNDGWLENNNGPGMNAYHAVSTFTSCSGARTKVNTQYTPGVWVDLDVKGGAFPSADAIREFVYSLSLRPTRVVATGSGGVHLYWKFTEPSASSRAEELCRGVWCWLQELADSVEVDRITTPEHLMRTPGSVRWPKTWTESPSLCQFTNWEGPEYEPATIWETVRDPYERRKDSIARRHSEWTETRRRAHELLNIGLSGHGIFARALATQAFEDVFSQRFTWDEILVPLGWSLSGRAPDGKGRREWTAPGGTHARTATTDWVDAPDRMSLLSSSPRLEPLVSLHESGISLTKYVVYVNMSSWRGDQEGFIQWWKENMQ